MPKALAEESKGRLGDFLKMFDMTTGVMQYDTNPMKALYNFSKNIQLPSWELTVSLFKGTFESMFFRLSPLVGYVIAPWKVTLAS